MFIRVKVVKGKKYAYLVKNTWKHGSARQKVSKYLGKVHTLLQVKNIDFETFVEKPIEEYLQASPRKIILDLVARELINHGFEKRRGVWIRESLEINLYSVSFKENRKPFVLHINGDYLCPYTLRKLLNFKSSNDEVSVGKELAKAFISAGIAVPENIFIEVFQKVYKPGQSFVY
ncbi:MAG: hypothetical protein QXK37_03370 [Candidatus Woesearchaeota archaeon]